MSCTPPELQLRTFRGTSGIDIDLRRVDINQCKSVQESGQFNIFGGTDKCKTKTTAVREAGGSFDLQYTDYQTAL